MKWLRLRMRPLPLRLWLVVVVVAVTGAGFLAQMAFVAPVSVWEQQTEDARISSVRQLIGTDAERWRDPVWQRNAHAQLAALNVDIALFPPPNQASEIQQPIFMTAGAHQFLDTGGQGVSTATADQTSPETPLVFQRMVIANPAQPANSPPVGVAFVWDASSTHGALVGLLWALVELCTFGLTLAIVVWLIGQPVIRPLIEMSQAADSIAGGNLKVWLSRSPVHEIAQVSEALEGMTVTLRASLARQESLERERRLFIGAVAHDLRTPLFMLRGYLQGLQRGVAATPEKAAHYLAMCQTKADELERLIADLFAFTRLEYLELEPECQPLEMGEMLRQVIEGAQTMAATRDITVTLDAPPAPAHLLGDAHLLARAVENLVDNAIRYTPAGGDVSLRWRVEGEHLALSVVDSGPGIAAHDLAHLFKPLYRGEDSRNRQTGGAGIGLATAKRIFVAHGGSLSAANRPDGGAIFTGILPMPRRTMLAHAPAASRIDGTGEP